MSMPTSFHVHRVCPNAQLKLYAQQKQLLKDFCEIMKLPDPKCGIEYLLTFQNYHVTHYHMTLSFLIA